MFSDCRGRGQLAAVLAQEDDVPALTGAMDNCGKGLGSQIVDPAVPWAWGGKLLSNLWSSVYMLLLSGNPPLVTTTITTRIQALTNSGHFLTLPPHLELI